MVIELNGAFTLLAALATIEAGKRINRIVPAIDRGNIPPAVSAGLVLSLLFAVLRAKGIVDFKFSSAPRDVLLLVFFATLGFGAHLGRLASAGKGAFIVCVAITLAIVGQNLVGMAVARSFGEPPLAGLFMGSIAYLGGHGTATAWAKSAEGALVPGAFEVGIASATLGLVLGGLVAGPVSSWLAKRSAGEAPVSAAAGEATGGEELPALASDRWIAPLMWVLACLALGPFVREWAAGLGFAAPAFLAVMLVGVAITNAADAAGRPLDTDVTDLVGTIALRIFLAIAMLSLDWAELAQRLPMLLTGAAAQAALTVVVGVVVVYLMGGRDRDAAAATGGFIGFSLGAMPVGLAVMRRLNATVGDTPRALLAITLAASLYTDTANAVILALFFRAFGG